MNACFLFLFSSFLGGEGEELHDGSFSLDKAVYVTPPLFLTTEENIAET